MDIKQDVKHANVRQLKLVMPKINQESYLVIKKNTALKLGEKEH